MRGGSNSRGYTIVETMIFLAVSGIMFLIAANFVSGKQGKTEFRESMDDINTQVQQVINDVSNGFYPSGENFTCSAVGANPPTIVAGAGKQGTNKNCTFIGKVIQFGVNGTNGSGFNVYSIAGRQYAPSPPAASPNTDVPINFAQAKPSVIYNLGPPLVDVTDKRQLRWAAQATKVTNAGLATSGIGFFTSFGNYDAGGSLKSGSQSVVTVTIPGGLNIKEEPDMINAINSGITDLNVRNSPDILVCFDSGHSQFGTLNIGGSNGQRLTSRVQIYETKPAAC